MKKLNLILVAACFGFAAIADEATSSQTAVAVPVATAAVAAPAPQPEAKAETAPAAEAKADDDSLDAELQRLATENNMAPAGVSKEQLYAVQYRYVPLRHRHEVTLGGGRNFTPDSYITSNQIDLTYRFYLSDKWFVGLAGSYVFNDLSSSGQRLLAEEAILPDATFTKYRGDLSLGYNLFYGKFRLSMDEVFYFDNYVSVGPGLVQYDGSKEWGVAGDIGFAGYFGKHVALRLGLKDYFVKEVRRKSQGWTHNLIGHLDIGYLF